MNQLGGANHTPNVRFKTTICRHWEQTKTCSRGENCHFAHGKEELRDMTDVYMASMYSNPSSYQTHAQWPTLNQPPNFKTILCKYYESENSKGVCKFGDNCNFAHGKHELRKPEHNQQAQITQYAQMQQAAYMQQVMQNNFAMAQMVARISQQLNQLIQEVEKAITSEDINKKVQAARQLLLQGNIQECANKLNEIIYREDATEEEKEAYKRVLEAMQQQANTQQQMYMQMYQMQPQGMPQFGSEELQSQQPQMPMPNKHQF